MSLSYKKDIFLTSSKKRTFAFFSDEFKIIHQFLDFNFTTVYSEIEFAARTIYSVIFQKLKTDVCLLAFQIQWGIFYRILRRCRSSERHIGLFIWSFTIIVYSIAHI